MDEICQKSDDCVDSSKAFMPGAVAVPEAGFALSRKTAAEVNRGPIQIKKTDSLTLFDLHKRLLALTAWPSKVFSKDWRNRSDPLIEPGVASVGWVRSSPILLSKTETSSDCR
jgi:hypothetical protein